MITCEFCGTQAEQHDHWRHEIMARVAALEDVVTREPPAEQPNAVHLKGCGAILSVRQPRGMCGWIFADGSQSLCAKCKEAAVPAEQPIRQETGGDCGVPGCHACAAMRDRAQAEAAEQDDEDGGMCCHFNEDRRAPRSCTKDRGHDGPHHYGPRPTKQPAEPSETGQVPSVPAGFRVVGQSGPGVVQSKGLWIRRARDCRDDSPANGEPRQITLPGSLGGVWDSGEYDVLEPIAEPPAPAAVTLSIADRLRQYNIEVERDYLIAEVGSIKAQLDQAEKELAERGRQVEQMAEHVAKMRVELDEASRVREDKALRERDEMATSREWWMERYNEAAKERDEATATIERVAYNTPEAVARSESDVTVLIELRRAQKERDEATARERERCLEVVETYEPRRDVTADWSYQGALARVSERIRSGANAIAPKCDPDPPREVAPDRAQAGSGGPYERCLAVRYGSGSCAKPNGHAMEHRDDDGNTW